MQLGLGKWSLMFREFEKLVLFQPMLTTQPWHHHLSRSTLCIYICIYIYIYIKPVINNGACFLDCKSESSAILWPLHEMLR